jgi:signal transduction histidine kinase
MPTNVLLCDTPDEVAKLQYRLLLDAPDLLVEVSTDAVRAVETAVRLRPEVVVCELSMEGVSGVELIRRIVAAAPAARVLARSMTTDAALVAEVLAAGATGYLAKDDSVDALIGAVRSAAAGGVVLSSRAAGPLGTELARALTRVHDLEAELDEVRESVTKGTSAKADFLANISHELRTPVTVAKGIAYVLNNPAVTDTERAQFMEQLQESLDKLMAIVDELITVAEMERGVFELDRQLMDLAPLVRQAVDQVDREYPGVVLISQIAESLIAFADGPRVGGVVHELLDNACRYSPPGLPVELVARNLSEGIVVMVTDRGEGLDRAVATRAFEEPFSTGEAILRKEKAGVGVGLHLARQMVVEHGGIMWADPLPGGGTRVSFCIPAHEGERVELPPAGAA